MTGPSLRYIFGKAFDVLLAIYPVYCFVHILTNDLSESGPDNTLKPEDPDPPKGTPAEHRSSNLDVKKAPSHLDINRIS